MAPKHLSLLILFLCSAGALWAQGPPYQTDDTLATKAANPFFNYRVPFRAAR
jgi:hypothetical protein